MTFKYWSAARALGGFAAGLLALVASPAASREGPIGAGASQAGGLRAVGGEGVLTPLTETASLKAMETASVIRLSALSGSVAWNASNHDPLTCLAQAIYFEARSESAMGQQAVAQVVMNRTHLPQFADTVCGVVYQGWERSTGCQFTFVCDGSLREPDDLIAWDRATEIAKKALAGFVYKPLLGATHYHAAWMTPYWSGQLTRIRQIGGHVFYH